MVAIVLAALASHFSMVGYKLNLEDRDKALTEAGAFLSRCELTRLRADDYLCVVRDKSGAELWIGVKKSGTIGELTTLNPALKGEGRMAITVEGDLSTPEWKPFEATVQVRFSSERIPVVLDLADPRELTLFKPGAALDVDVTAFADEISLHDNERGYDAAQTDQELKWASNHFVPSGMFTGGSDKGPTAHAMFAGTILKAELRQNTEGTGKFWWFLVETYGGAAINVVADPETVKASPKVGGLLAGSFWMSARVRRP